MDDLDAQELLERLQKSTDRLMAMAYDARVVVDALDRSVAETRGWLLFYLDAINPELQEVSVE
jgi:hypothetical protein